MSPNGDFAQDAQQVALLATASVEQRSAHLLLGGFYCFSLRLAGSSPALRTLDL